MNNCPQTLPALGGWYSRIHCGEVFRKGISKLFLEIEAMHFADTDATTTTTTTITTTTCITNTTCTTTTTTTITTTATTITTATTNTCTTTDTTYYN